MPGIVCSSLPSNLRDLSFMSQTCFDAWQTSPDGTQHEIKGATSTSYTARKEDIDGLICVSCEPMRMDGARGPIMLSQCVGPILPGKFSSLSSL